MVNNKEGINQFGKGTIDKLTPYQRYYEICKLRARKVELLIVIQELKDKLNKAESELDNIPKVQDRYIMTLEDLRRFA